MNVYTNNSYEIIAIDAEPQHYEYVFKCDHTRTEIFGDLCDICIQGYKYEPQYELIFNEDGSNKIDEKTGELLYKLDIDGNKILNGYACYPFIDCQMLMLIQKQYGEYKKREIALTAKIDYISMMAGIKTDVDQD
ncbi:hypothetical protein [Lacrimispora amygdalina]|uniref:hypothetical protein n=1 Tax=Lacrimispora amygdalina TaxID=253257 RepID=UPI000BE2DBA7|nr:hypothetical protein [Lacrimispora amygdalina]